MIVRINSASEVSIQFHILNKTNTVDDAMTTSLWMTDGQQIPPRPISVIGPIKLFSQPKTLWWLVRWRSAAQNTLVQHGGHLREDEGQEWNFRCYKSPLMHSVRIKDPQVFGRNIGASWVVYGSSPVKGHSFHQKMKSRGYEWIGRYTEKLSVTTTSMLKRCVVLLFGWVEFNLQMISNMTTLARFIKLDYFIYTRP